MDTDSMVGRRERRTEGAPGALLKGCYCNADKAKIMVKQRLPS